MALPSSSRRMLCTVITLGAAAAAVAQPLGLQDGSAELPTQQLLSKRADRSTTQAKLIDGETPQGPIVLVFGALGIAVACLIFVAIKANISSDKRLTQERQKAKTDLRLKGGQVSPTGSRTMLNASTRSPLATPLMSRSDLGNHGPSVAGASNNKRASGGRPYAHSPRGYSGSYVSRDSGMKSNYTSFSGSSMAEIPMLSATGRMATTMSSYSTSSGEPSSQTPTTPGRVPRPPIRQAPSGHRHSTSTVFRGTNLYTSRNSTAAPPVVNPSAVDAAYSPRSGSPKLTTGNDLKRYVTDSYEHSRRNSASGLLDDDPFTPLSPYHSAPSSADHSGVLSPTNSHPLAGPRTQAAGDRSAAAAASSSAGSSSASVSSGSQARTNESSSNAPPYPSYPARSGPSVAGDRASTLRPGIAAGGPRAMRNAERSGGFFQYGVGPNAGEAEQGQNFEQLRPGQLAQPIGDGNGRRGRKGQPVGGASYV